MIFSIRLIITETRTKMVGRCLVTRLRYLKLTNKTFVIFPVFYKKQKYNDL